MSATRRRRVLFVLSEPGYFRLYGSTIVELGRRGCEVLLAFDRPEKRGASMQVPAGASTNVRSLGALPGAAPAASKILRAALDYIRYLEPAFAGAAYLRQRAEKHLPGSLRFLAHVPQLPRWVVSGAIGAGRLLERMIPVDGGMREFVRRVAPDAIVVSPVVITGENGALQTELVKAGRAAGVPVVVGAASWDHLTSKGLIRVIPDAVTVWNRAQLREAVDLHRIPESRVMVTGAQSLDHWFEHSSGAGAEQLRRQLGIGEAQRVILFVGSSRNMAPADTELRFVRRWRAALRASPDPSVRSAFVIVRPHPTNTDVWRDADLGDAAVSVHPRGYSGIPLSDDEVETFRRSLLASAVVVGINTTAMIEAAILARPVLTIRDPDFMHSQEQTLHFGYLSDASSGCAVVAASLDEHIAQLSDVLRDPRPAVEAARRFAREFVRPRGIEVPATMSLCDTVEAIARRGPRRAHTADASLDDQVLAASRGAHR